jgi:hypothetical protein
VIALAALAVGLCWCIAPGVGWFDAGELSTAALELGVPHPTGFPLLALAGHALARLPLGDGALRVNLLGALAAVTAGWLWRRALARSASWPGTRQAGWTGAVLEGLLIALPLWAPAIWLHVCATEVYPLVFVVASVVAWAWTPGPDGWATGSALADGRRVVALGLATGLALGVHAEAVLLAGLAWLAAVVRHRRAGPVLLGLVLAMLAATCVVYLPLAARRDPGLSWGDVRSWPALADHLSAASIRHVFADRIGTFDGGVRMLGHLVWRDGGWLLLPAALGAWTAGRAAWPTLAIVAVDAVYATVVNPMGLRDDQAGLLVLWGLGVLAAQAVWWLAASWRWPAVVAGGLAAVWAMVQALAALPSADLRAPARLADRLWRNVPPGALLITGSDHRASLCLWSQSAAGARPDALCLPGAFLHAPPMLRSVARRTGREGFGTAAGRRGHVEVLRSVLQPALDGAGVLWQPGHAELDAQVAGHLQGGAPWLRLVRSSVAPTPLGSAVAEQVNTLCRALDCGGAPHLSAHLGVDLALVASMVLRGDGELGRQLLQQAAKLAPRAPPVLNNLAVVELEQGNAAGALRLAEQALTAQPDYARAHRTAARALLHLGRDDDAVAAAERYARQSRDAAPWLATLAREASPATAERLQSLAH